MLFASLVLLLTAELFTSAHQPLEIEYSRSNQNLSRSVEAIRTLDERKPTLGSFSASGIDRNDKRYNCKLRPQLANLLGFTS
jgi:hypothetical protein